MYETRKVKKMDREAHHRKREEMKSELREKPDGKKEVHAVFSTSR